MGLWVEKAERVVGELLAVINGAGFAEKLVQVAVGSEPVSVLPKYKENI